MNQTSAPTAPPVSSRTRPEPTYDDLFRLMSLMTGDEKHSSAATSTLDVLWVLYHRVLRVSPETMEDLERDRFLLSKGHGPMAYYAVLAAHGFLPEEWLPGWTAWESPLGHHPDRVLLPGVEISSGSLGHGLPLAVGTALGLRARGIGSRVVVLVGDAELDEGSNHEAIALAGARRLERLTVVVVDNASASYRRSPRLAPLFDGEDFDTAVVDGRDHAALERAFTVPTDGRPRAIVARVEDAR